MRYLRNKHAKLIKISFTTMIFTIKIINFEVEF